MIEEIGWKSNVVAREVVNEVDRPDPFAVRHQRSGAADPLVSGNGVTFSAHGAEDLFATFEVGEDPSYIRRWGPSMAKVSDAL
ncbi:hypothetical protein [Streptomyces chrestomyceticus]|uniref:hypothetical protein n=1 Tax=Streptomyces chrestomyceticus TaxID=68185 RepID=UPI000F626DFE|nr:hypothetical protein [Streptomyces chrestomyceticus]